MHGKETRGRRFARDAKIVTISVALTSVGWLLAYALLDPYRPVEPLRGTETGGSVSSAASPEPASGPASQQYVSPAPIVGETGSGPLLRIPVAGVQANALVDTFRDARESGARVHDAIDIMAPAGTPVIAAWGGKIERLFQSDDGGRTIYIRAPGGGQVHYYAHLRNYAPGLREGQQVRAGDRLGTVGSTGNADPAAPHLHFAVMRMEPGEEWFEGSAINPYRLMTGRR